MSHIASRHVEFHDTDMAGIVHFAVYFRLMESVEHEFLRTLGFSVVSEDEHGQVSWPRVSATCDFRRPAKFGDVLQIELKVAALGNSSVTYEFVFRRGAEELAIGTMTSVCCRIVDGETPKPMSIPQHYREKIRIAQK